MNNLKYYSHLILSSKYKFLTNLIIFLLINLIFCSSIDKNLISECMMRAPSMSSSESDANIIDNLLEQINLLNQEIEQYKELQITEKAKHKAAIETLEENQLHLIRENRFLKAQLAEAKETISKTIGDNMDLRGRLIVQREHIEGLRRNLEIAHKHNEQLSLALIDLEKYKI